MQAASKASILRQCGRKVSQGSRSLPPAFAWSEKLPPLCPRAHSMSQSRERSTKTESQFHHGDTEARRKAINKLNHSRLVHCDELLPTSFCLISFCFIGFSPCLRVFVVNWLSRKMKKAFEIRRPQISLPGSSYFF